MADRAASEEAAAAEPGAEAKPNGRTMQERSHRTQQAILDAAVEVLVLGGYSAATTVAVQRRAGVSRGRLLHHFPSRNELLIAAVHHLAESRIRAMPVARDWPEDPEERIDAAIDTMWESYRQSYFWAASELWLAARHDEELRQALEPHERQLGRLIRQVAAEFFGEELASRPRFSELVSLLHSSFRGTAFTYSFTQADPDREPMMRIWRLLAREWLLE